MLVQIRNMYTFATVATYNATAWTWASGVDGEIVITTFDDLLPSYVNGFTNNWLIAEKELFWITAATFDENSIRLSIGSPTNFLRHLKYLSSTRKNVMKAASLSRTQTWQYYFQQVARQISDWTSYTYPTARLITYVTWVAPPERTDPLPFDVTAEAASDLFNIDDSDYIIDAAIEQGVAFSFELINGGVTLTLSHAVTAPAEQIIFDGVNNKLTNEQYESSMITELWVNFVWKKGKTTAGNVTNSYYLGTDGRFHATYWTNFDSSGTATSTTATGDTFERVEGGDLNIVYVNPRTVNTYAKAQDELQKYAEDNRESYVLEFKSKRRFLEGQKLRFKLHGQIFETEVSSATRQNGELYYSIKCGNLNCTVKEKLQYKVNSSTLYL